MELTDAQRAFKAEYIQKRGYWVTFNDGLLQYSQAFLETYLRYAGLPARVGALTARMRELVYVAADASATHMFAEGLAIHTRMALAAGATPQDVIETLQIATAQGLDGTMLGVGILVEELRAGGHDTAFMATELTAEQEGLRSSYMVRFGDWPPFCDQLLRLSPAYFGVVAELLDAPSVTGSLMPVERELIGIALNASLTQMDPAGLRLHIARALRLGATRHEILEVLQLTAHLGIHACVVGVPLLMAALETKEPA